jgi:hypothetical protein
LTPISATHLPGWWRKSACLKSWKEALARVADFRHLLVKRVAEIGSLPLRILSRSHLGMVYFRHPLFVQQEGGPTGAQGREGQRPSVFPGD